MPTGNRPFPPPLNSCICSVPTELGIPCYHTIYYKISSGTSFTKQEVHPRWRIRESSSQDPYRRIIDPRITTSLRGRPKNTAQSVPSQLAINRPIQHRSEQSIQVLPKRKRGRPRGSLNRSITVRLTPTQDQASSQETNLSQRQTQRRSARLGAGRSSGVRSSGQRLRSSIRRERSQWEIG